MLRRWIIFTSLLLVAAAVPLAAVGLWSYPASSRSFDRGGGMCDTSPIGDAGAFAAAVGSSQYR